MRYGFKNKQSTQHATKIWPVKYCKQSFQWVGPDLKFLTEKLEPFFIQMMCLITDQLCYVAPPYQYF